MNKLELEAAWKKFSAKLPKDEKLERDLLQQLADRHSELLLQAMQRIGRAHNVEIPLSYAVSGRLCGCRINYNSKAGKFTFIQYPILGKRGGGPYAKRIELE